MLCAFIGRDDKPKIQEILSVIIDTNKLIDFTNSTELIRTAITWLIVNPPTKKQALEIGAPSKDNKVFSDFLLGELKNVRSKK